MREREACAAIAAELSADIPACVAQRAFAHKVKRILHQPATLLALLVVSERYTGTRCWLPFTLTISPLEGSVLGREN